MHVKRTMVLELLLVLLCFLSACGSQDSRSLPSNSAKQKQEKTVAASEPIQTDHPSIIEVDYSAYFNGFDGSAVFYTPERKAYRIYNREAAEERCSPCSTFKIVSALTALENDVITPENSMRKWSGEQFWKEDWNGDMELEKAFKGSCVWYFRELINEIGEEKMRSAVEELGYGNCDISDWEGVLNQNNGNRALTGFWVESSLKISPKEQTEVLSRIFGSTSPYEPAHTALMKELMTIEQDKTALVIRGKTGYGKLGSTSLDSWFVGMFTEGPQTTYFAVHLGETDNPEASSALAKEIAVQIIADDYHND